MSRGEKKVAEQFGLIETNSSHSPNKGKHEDLVEETSVNYHSNNTAPQYFIFSESAA